MRIYKQRNGWEAASERDWCYVGARSWIRWRRRVQSTKVHSVYDTNDHQWSFFRRKAEKEGTPPVLKIVELVKQTQMMLHDEVHHIGDNQWFEMTKAFVNAFYRFGFSGTMNMVRWRRPPYASSNRKDHL